MMGGPRDGGGGSGIREGSGVAGRLRSGLSSRGAGAASPSPGLSGGRRMGGRGDGGAAAAALLQGGSGDGVCGGERRSYNASGQRRVGVTALVGAVGSLRSLPTETLSRLGSFCFGFSPLAR